MLDQSASTPAEPLNHKEGAGDEDGTEGGELCVIYIRDPWFLCSLAVYRSREEVQEMVRPTLAVTHFAQAAAPPSVMIELAPPVLALVPVQVPARVAGSKRKFTDDQDDRSNSVNPARRVLELPCVTFFSVFLHANAVPRSRLKRRKIEHAAYPTHKRLAEVKALTPQRMEVIKFTEATKLTEAIKLGVRRRMRIWSSWRPPLDDVANRGSQTGRVE